MKRRLRQKRKEKSKPPIDDGSQQRVNRIFETREESKEKEEEKQVEEVSSKQRQI